MKKIICLILIFLTGCFAFAESTDIDQDLLDFVDELNQEDFLGEMEIINSLYAELQTIPDLVGVDVEVILGKRKPYNDDFSNLSVSDKMKIMKENYMVNNDIINALINLHNKNNASIQKAFDIMNQISVHENKLFNIFERIIKSSNDNVSATINLLEETQNNLQNVSFKLDLAEQNIKLMNESLAYQERKNKNAFITGNIIIPIVGCMAILGSTFAVINADENSIINPDLATGLLYASVGLTISCEITWNCGHLIFKWW